MGMFDARLGTLAAVAPQDRTPDIIDSTIGRGTIVPRHKKGFRRPRRWVDSVASKA